MTTLLVTLGWGLLALLALSVLVALWEFLRSTERRPWTGTPAASQAPALDVDLAQLGSADQRQREAVLDSALARLGSATGNATSLQAWSETRPMVTPGSAAGTPRSESAA